jgi:hypothetical protein
MKYESPITYHSKDMANVKVFADKQTDRRTGQKLYVPDLSIQGHKNQGSIIYYFPLTGYSAPFAMKKWVASSILCKN